MRWCWGKLPVPGRPTMLITVGQGPIALAVGAVVVVDAGGGDDELKFNDASTHGVILRLEGYTALRILKGKILKVTHLIV